MNKIEIGILNPEVIDPSIRMMVTAARLTQKGHMIHSLNDFYDLYNKSFTEKTVKNMIELPHPTIQKFGVINVVIIGASRRFLAQITRHQNEVKFMSASCQYSDYSGQADFVIPYEILKNEELKEFYINHCNESLKNYEDLINSGINHDDAAYLLPQGLRNILIISATPYQWKHMISQRSCRRNTSETRFIMLKIWNELYNLDQLFFSDCGPFCMNNICQEGGMSCNNPMIGTPIDILRTDYNLIKEVNK